MTQVHRTAMLRCTRNPPPDFTACPVESRQYKKNKNAQHSVKKHLRPFPKVCCSVERFVLCSNDAFHHELPNDDDLYVERFILAHSEDGFMQSDVRMRQNLKRVKHWVFVSLLMSLIVKCKYAE